MTVHESRHQELTEVCVSNLNSWYITRYILTNILGHTEYAITISSMNVPVCQGDNIILVETPLLSKTPEFTGRAHKYNLIEWNELSKTIVTRSTNLYYLNEREIDPYTLVHSSCWV